MGGTKGWLGLNFCCVMNGCIFACCGDHLSRGLVVSKPLTKSMKATRLFISEMISFVNEILRWSYLVQSLLASCSFEA